MPNTDDGIALAAGTEVGAYRLVERLGEGKHGVVFKAYHSDLDRFVAIKVMKPEYAADETASARFGNQARIVAQLDHPNIVPIYDLGASGAQPYTVMKLVEGESLLNTLARGTMPVADSARLAGAAGSALQAAHDRGLVHGALKPSNLLLARDGHIYLSDFAGGAAQAGHPSLADAHFASPEQVGPPHTATPASDQYALAVLLFLALTGAYPFHSDDAQVLYQQHLAAPPPHPAALRPDLSRAVGDIIVKALSKAPSQRYGDMAAFVAAFQRYAAPPRLPTAPLPPAHAYSALSDAVELEDSMHVGQDLDPAATTIMLAMPGGHTFKLAGRAEYTLGRAETTRGTRPDVDLAQWRGVELGVSRQHGRLHFADGRLYYTDLRSANGSRVNGARPKPHAPVELAVGDELCLGKVIFRVYIGA